MAAVAVPNSAGTSSPRFKAPPHACDCHLHVYDPRFPMAWPQLRATPNASAAEYRLLQERLGTERAVVVQPAAYGTDNRVTLAAIEYLGRARTRGVAVVHPAIDEAELAALHEGGIRGLRLSQHDAKTAVTTPEMIEPLAARAAALGWHVQLHLRGEQLVEMASLIERLPCTLVLDHAARIPQPEGVGHAAFKLVARLLEGGRTWVKLSGAYLDSKTGAPRYADVARMMRELVRLAPQRMLWGSDWPHPTERDDKPDDAVLFDLAQECAGDEDNRRLMLVDNPAALYGF